VEADCDEDGDESGDVIGEVDSSVPSGDEIKGFRRGKALNPSSGDALREDSNGGALDFTCRRRGLSIPKVGCGTRKTFIIDGPRSGKTGIEVIGKFKLMNFHLFLSQYNVNNR
jgi:hypothetical protein